MAKITFTPIITYLYKTFATIMPATYHTEDVYTEIIEELEQLKNLYPYSNNNEVYNKVIDICIDKIKEISENRSS